MPLLHEPRRRLHRVGHLQPRHDDGQAAARERRDRDLVLDVAELGAAVVGRRGGGVGGQDAEVVQFGEEEGFVPGAEGVGGGEEGEAVGELSGLGV